MQQKEGAERPFFLQGVSLQSGDEEHASNVVSAGVLLGQRCLPHVQGPQE